MKYRRLRADELKDLEPDFVRFLAANALPADSWEKLKQEKPEAAEELIEQFSEVVFEKVLTNVEYLEFKTPKDIKVFHCQEDKITMLGLEVKGNTDLDFTKTTDPAEMNRQLQVSGANANVYRAEKQYKGDRKMELFKMMESGCLISKGLIYNALKELVE